MAYCPTKGTFISQGCSRGLDTQRLEDFCESFGDDLPKILDIVDCDWLCTHLVGGLVAMNFMFPEILGCDYHPNWRTHIFQRGGPTTNQPFYLGVSICFQLVMGVPRDISPDGLESSEGQSHLEMMTGDNPVWLRKPPYPYCWWLPGPWFTDEVLWIFVGHQQNVHHLVFIVIWNHMGVSIDRCSPKWKADFMENLSINGWFGGHIPQFLELSICSLWKWQKDSIQLLPRSRYGRQQYHL